MTLSSAERERERIEAQLQAVNHQPDAVIQKYIDELVRDGEPTEDSYRGQLLKGYRQLLVSRKQAGVEVLSDAIIHHPV